jgi:N,N-dimethylformamidase
MVCCRAPGSYRAKVVHRSEGGAVFATGSIAWATSLSHAGYENDVARIGTNVLLRFADPQPFDPPAWAGREEE